jgi:hypothetical protein
MTISSSLVFVLANLLRVSFLTDPLVDFFVDDSCVWCGMNEIKIDTSRKGKLEALHKSSLGINGKVK